VQQQGSQINRLCSGVSASRQANSLLNGSITLVPGLILASGNPVRRSQSCRLSCNF
jgi:hypothetical protein